MERGWIVEWAPTPRARSRSAVESVHRPRRARTGTRSALTTPRQRGWLSGLWLDARTWSCGRDARGSVEVEGAAVTRRGRLRGNPGTEGHLESTCVRVSQKPREGRSPMVRYCGRCQVRCDRYSEAPVGFRKPQGFLESAKALLHTKPRRKCTGGERANTRSSRGNGTPCGGDVDASALPGGKLPDEHRRVVRGNPRSAVRLKLPDRVVGAERRREGEKP